MVEDWEKVNILKSEKKKPVQYNLEDDPVLVRKKKRCSIYRKKKRERLVRRKEKVTVVILGSEIVVDFYFLL